MNNIKIFLTLLLVCFLFPSEVFSQDQNKKNTIVIIEGIVENIAPPMPLSGVIASYRLVKYKVINVCRGEYNEKEIVIDHFVITGNELENTKVGDKVYVPALVSEQIEVRYNPIGIRHLNDKIDKFYIGYKVFLANESDCSYDESEILLIRNK